MNCDNCKASLNCSCQLRIATNGQRCCTACVESYNASLTGNSVTVGQPSPNNYSGTAPVIQSIVYNPQK